MYKFPPAFIGVILLIFFLLVTEYFEFDGILAIMHLPFLFIDEEVEA